MSSNTSSVNTEFKLLGAADQFKGALRRFLQNQFRSCEEYYSDCEKKKNPGDVIRVISAWKQHTFNIKTCGGMGFEECGCLQG